VEAGLEAGKTEKSTRGKALIHYVRDMDLRGHRYGTRENTALKPLRNELDSKGIMM